MSELSANKIQINFNKSIKNSNKNKVKKKLIKLIKLLQCSKQTKVNIKQEVDKTKPISSLH